MLWLHVMLLSLRGLRFVSKIRFESLNDAHNLQVVHEDGKKVRRQHPLTQSDMEELQVGFICISPIS